MKMKLMMCFFACLLMGCSGNNQSNLPGFSKPDKIEGFSEEQNQILIADDALYEKVKNACPNQPSVKVMLEETEFDPSNIELLCNVELKSGRGLALEALLATELTSEQVEALIELPFYRISNTERYLAYLALHQDESMEDIVVEVNIGIDQPFFTNVKVIEDTSDRTMLINKYHGLPENYEPEELIVTPSPCTIGFHYSCSTNDPQYVEKVAGEHFNELVEAGAQVGIKVNSIASYRTYDYQRNLYNYNYNTYGQEHADLYYARPGQSEHNSGLAIDVTLNDMNYNEIEIGPDYPWLMENMADYGFILRYPEDKTHLTGYGYESWHLRYVGKDTAQEIMNQGWCLEEYYARKVSE